MPARAFLRGLVPLVCLAAAPLVWGCARGTELVSVLEESGTIGGRVLDSRNGSPIAGVLIVASPGAASATTDATGHFQLSDLDLDVEYTVTALKAGYTTSTVRVPVTREQSFISIEFTLLRFAVS